MDRDALCQVMRSYGVCCKLLKAVQSFYVDSKACVRIGNEVNEWYSVNVGVRQDCVMSQWLFNLYMAELVREVQARILGRGEHSWWVMVRKNGK